MAKRIPKILYHYCSLPTFQKIIENKSIWLSDISKSNDSLEMKWIYDLFHQYFLQKEVECLEEVISINSIIMDMYKKGEQDIPLLPEYDQEQIDNLEDSIRDIYQDQNKSYVFCFSELSDSLSQWRGYADDGCGMAIGFKRDYFTLFNTLEGTDAENMFLYDKIVYGEASAIKYFNNYSGFNMITGKSSSNEIKRIFEKAVTKISERAAFFKSSSFKEEKEWRIAITLMNNNNTYFDISAVNSSTKQLFEDRYSLNELAFISTLDKLIPHIEMSLPKLQDAIEEIYIGPKSQVSIEDIRMFLIANGLLNATNMNSIKIIRSASSYR